MAREERRNHPWAAWQAHRRQNRPLSATTPGPCVAGAGIDWRTSAHKGNPFLRRRAPAPNTADRKGHPDGLRSRQAIGRPSLWAEETKIRSARVAQSVEELPSGLRLGSAGRDAHTVQERVARWASRRVLDTSHAAEGEHGPCGMGVDQEPLRPP